MRHISTLISSLTSDARPPSSLSRVNQGRMAHARCTIMYDATSSLSRNSDVLLSDVGGIGSVTLDLLILELRLGIDLFRI